MDKILKIEFRVSKNGHDFVFMIPFGCVSYDDASEVLKELSLELEIMREDEKKRQASEQEKAVGEIDGGV
jgi:hypothetical protein